MHARNFTTNVPKILDLKSSSKQIFFRKLSLGAPVLLRPGAMVEGVERAAKRRIRPVSFHTTIYNLVKIWEAKTLKQTNR